MEKIGEEGLSIHRNRRRKTPYRLQVLGHVEYYRRSVKEDFDACC